jgi:ribokinase
VARAVELASKHRVNVVLNPSPAQSLEASLLARVDYLIPNQSELALLAGMVDRASAVQSLRDLGVQNVVVTLGEEGVLVVDELGEAFLPANQVEVADATAAGDAFAGAFAVALSEGASNLEAARWGNAAGALAVTRAGAQPSLPTREEIERLLR